MPFDPQAFATAGRQDEAPPDATYEVELIAATIITANADGRQWAKLSWKVLAGPQRDESWDSLHGLDRYNSSGELSPQLDFTKDTLERIGVDTTAVASEDDLVAAMRACVGRAYNVEVKRSGGFTNSYVRGHVLGPNPTPTPPQPAAPAAPQAPAQQAQGGSILNPPPERRDVERVENPPPDIPVEPYPQPEPVPARGDIDPVTGKPWPF
jgi:hypothetical protein